MIKGEIKEKLTLKNILKRVSQYDIIRYYLGFDFKFNKKVKSCFRKNDNEPSLSFKLEKSDIENEPDNIIYVDFGDSTYKGGVIKFVQQLFNIDYQEALKKIDEDLGLEINKKSEISYKEIIKDFKKPEETVNKPTHFQIVPGNFNEKELKYWKQYYITEKELKDNNVYSIDSLFINKKLVPSFNLLRFAYVYDDKIKIYYPYADKKFKWLTNTPIDYISGLDDIKYKCFSGTKSNKLIITKSKKDEIIFKKFFSDVCSTQNESKEAINQNNINFFIQHYGAENIYIVFDNDEPGVKACKYYNQFGFKYFNIPKKYLEKGITDASDIVKAYGLEMLEYLLKKKNML